MDCWLTPAWRRSFFAITNGVRGKAGKGMSHVCGILSRKSGQYIATQGFGGVIIKTKSCSLQSALEFLVILTSAKHRWAACSTSAPEAQRETLEEALEVAAREQGKRVKDMKLKFHIEYSNNFWFGKGRKVCSPVVHTLDHIFTISKVFELYKGRGSRIGGGRARFV